MFPIFIYCLVFMFHGLIQTPVDETFSIDRSILNKGVCELPCWNNIMPAETTADTINNQLSSVEFFSSALQTWRVNSNERLDIVWRHESQFELNRIVLVDNVVRSIKIYPNIEISIEDTLKLYSEPDMIQVEFVRAGFHPYHGLLTLHLIYPQQGLIISFEIDNLPTDVNTVKITPSLTSNYFTLYESGSDLTEFLMNRTSANQEIIQTMLRYYDYIGWLGWPGYDAVVQFPDLPTSDHVYIFPPTP